MHSKEKIYIPPDVRPSSQREAFRLPILGKYIPTESLPYDPKPPNKALPIIVTAFFKQDLSDDKWFATYLEGALQHPFDNHTDILTRMEGSNIDHVSVGGIPNIRTPSNYIENTQRPLFIYVSPTFFKHNELYMNKTQKSTKQYTEHYKL